MNTSSSGAFQGPGNIKSLRAQTQQLVHSRLPDSARSSFPMIAGYGRSGSEPYLAIISEPHSTYKTPTITPSGEENLPRHSVKFGEDRKKTLAECHPTL